MFESIARTLARVHGRKVPAMDILTTEMFRIVTAAGPDVVWRTLTTPRLTARWFHGLTLESDWRPGSPVTATSAAGRLMGEVLATTERRRLSFTLAAGDDQPETFVTWEIHHVDETGDGGSIVRLFVDEDADGGTESAWTPVVDALRSELAGSVAAA